MPQGPDGNTIIIVKKVSGHGGHHGGAWKVAYADFVTAMMALFMVLWLVNSASVTTKERIASYFKRPGVFEKGSGTPLEIGGGGILSDTFAPPAAANSSIVPSKEIYNVDTEGGIKNDGFAGGEKDLVDGGEGGDKEAAIKQAKKELATFSQMASQLEALFGGDRKEGNSAQGYLGQLDVKLDQRGLHLEIMDTPTASMFNLGSSTIRPEAGQELLKIAAILIQLPNPVDIEGHTDSRPFRAAGYDNWDLSIDRANAARRALQEAGMKSWQMNRVVGFADRRPKVSSDTMHPSNRRISISMRYTEQAAVVLKETGAIETRSVPVKMQPSIATNSPNISDDMKNVDNENDNSIESGDTNTATSGAASADEGLQLEVSTTAPHGEALAGPDDEETAARPSTTDSSDVIFGKRNPFFR